MDFLANAAATAAGLNAPSSGSKEIEELKQKILDEDVHVLTVAELNLLAFKLTYKEDSQATGFDLNEATTELLHSVLAQKTIMNFSTLAIEKALVVSRHLFLYGASSFVNEAVNILGRDADYLQSHYNVRATWSYSLITIG